MLNGVQMRRAIYSTTAPVTLRSNGGQGAAFHRGHVAGPAWKLVALWSHRNGASLDPVLPAPTAVAGLSHGHQRVTPRTEVEVRAGQDPRPPAVEAVPARPEREERASCPATLPTPPAAA